MKYSLYERMFTSIFVGWKCYLTIAISLPVAPVIEKSLHFHPWLCFVFFFFSKNSIFISLEHFSIGLSIFFSLICFSSLYIKDINGLLVCYKYFSCFFISLFILFIDSYVVNFCGWIWQPLLCDFGDWQWALKRSSLPTELCAFCLMFPPDMFMVSHFAVRYLYGKEHVCVTTCCHLLIIIAVSLG